MSTIIRHQRYFKKEESMAIIQKPGWFYYEEEGERLGEVSYLKAGHGKVLVLNHTYVDPKLRGQNIARQLVDAVCDLARSEGKKVQPDCRYAAALFKRFKEDYEDVALEPGQNADSCPIN